MSVAVLGKSDKREHTKWLGLLVPEAGADVSTTWTSIAQALSSLWGQCTKELNLSLAMLSWLWSGRLMGQVHNTSALITNCWRIYWPNPRSVMGTAFLSGNGEAFGFNTLPLPKRVTRGRGTRESYVRAPRIISRIRIELVKLSLHFETEALLLSSSLQRTDRFGVRLSAHQGSKRLTCWPDANSLVHEHKKCSTNEDDLVYKMAEIDSQSRQVVNLGRRTCQG